MSKRASLTKRKTSWPAIAGAGLFFLLSIGWIYSSDYLLAQMTQNAQMYHLISTVKGGLYVLLCSVLLYLYIVKVLRVRSRERAESEESKGKWRAALAATDQGVWEWNLVRNRVIFYGTADFLESISGDWREPEFWQERIHPDDFPTALAASNKLLTGNTEDYFCEYRLKNTEGTYRWIRSQGRVIERNSKGEATLVVGTAIDIDERRHRTDRMQEMAQIINLVPEMILVQDNEGVMTFVNRGAIEFLSLKNDVLIGRNVSEVGFVDTGLLREVKAATIESGSWSGEMDIDVSGRGRRRVLCSWSRIQAADGTVTGVIAAATDITERKEMEERFLRAQRLEVVGRLAAGIAHDLNNVLTPIGLVGGLVRSHLKSDEASSLLETLNASVERGARLLKQILLFSRGMEAEREVVELGVLAKDSVALSRETFPKSIRTGFELPDDLWEIIGNPTQVQQVVMNLCINAKDAMPEGGKLTISARNVILDRDEASKFGLSDGNYVALVVADTGTGISAELRKQIFDPFFTTKETGKGTGLGLATVLAIVENHKGHIEVESEPGVGTKFTIFWPAAHTGVPRASKISQRSEATAFRSAERGKILLVDDEEMVCAMTENALSQVGYDVISSTDSVEAIRRFSEDRRSIDLVVTDTQMPGVTGPELIRILRQLKPDIRLVVATGQIDESAAHEFRQMRVEGIIMKPFTVSELLDVVSSALADN